MIPLSVPNLSGNEWKYIKECLDTNWVSSVGSYVDKFEKVVADYTGAGYAVSTSNGSAAIHLSLLLAGVKKDDLVIVPNITFVAPVNCVRYLGADPILIDINDSDWQMDLDLLEQFLIKETFQLNGSCFYKTDGRKISCILPVHVLGNMCDMTRLISMADEHNITIVEDATEALGSCFKGRHAGTLTKLGCLSFNGNKIITTGGGGMILTNDKKIAEMAKHLSTQAKSDSFEYIHDETGFNYRLVNVLAAMGVAQMEQLAGFVKRKKEIADLYKRQLSVFPSVKFQNCLPEVEANNWLFTILVSSQKELISHLLKNDVQVRPLWMPMNRLTMYDNCNYITENDISFKVYRNSISLPCSTSISEIELLNVCNAIERFFN